MTANGSRLWKPASRTKCLSLSSPGREAKTTRSHLINRKIVDKRARVVT